MPRASPAAPARGRARSARARDARRAVAARTSRRGRPRRAGSDEWPMAVGRGQTPPDEELRRRAARLADGERRLARRERDVAAREAELRCDGADRRLRRMVLDGAAPVPSRAAVRHGVVAVVAVWLMAFPLVFPAERTPLRAAVLGAGAALAFLALAAAR